MEGTQIRDTDTGEPMTWGELIFLLHKHCNLDKWKIQGYTYPQIIDLLHQTQRNIRFEIETRMASMGIFSGTAGKGESSSSNSDADYHEMTEDDLNMFAKALGGG